MSTKIEKGEPFNVGKDFIMLEAFVNDREG